jgi:2-succinyl-6-hydroxy-2,4-cyclohexadiene-1-carboxylate synthase
MGSGVQPSLWDELKRLAVPALLIVGEIEEKLVAINRRMAAAMPAAALRRVANAGHAAQLEQPAVFQQLVLEFLRAISENGGQDLPGAEEDDEQQGRQRHLLEPRVEGR